MSYFADLTPWRCFGYDRLIAVGWLDSKQPYPRGAVDPAFLTKLKQLFTGTWQPIHSLGPHTCTLCPRLRLARRPTGARTLFIPGHGFLYVAPDLIVHYIEAHGYAPPSEVIAAVLGCPEIDSAAYRKAIEANGPRVPAFAVNP
jgi:hypothetical protein